jgi:hypothetical protein
MERVYHQVVFQACINNFLQHIRDEWKARHRTVKLQYTRIQSLGFEERPDTSKLEIPEGR